jgi:hypothetical protein
VNFLRQLLIGFFGISWKTTLCGLAEAGAIQALTYALNTEYHNPRVFWSGMGLSVIAAVRGRLSKDHDVTNAVPAFDSRPVK